MSFSAANLKAVLDGWPSPPRYLLALSGGLDSCVLLHALSNIPDLSPVVALHVNHGIHADAPLWSQFCVETCARLNIPIIPLSVQIDRQAGDSLEAKARAARYQAMAVQMLPGDMLLTAQHADDQAETLLLQLLRGSGPRGLASMPLLKRWKNGWLARPLLDFSRDQLAAYAKQHDLRWMEDPSNANLSFDRNYLRHSIIPELKSRWPGFLQTTGRTAYLCAQADLLNTELAGQDLARAGESNPWRLPLDLLTSLRPERQDNLLRHWIEQQGLPLPDQVKLLRIRQEVLTARRDRNPVVIWKGGQVRRYRQELFLLPGLPELDIAQIISLEVPGSIQLPGGLGQIDLNLGAHLGAKKVWLGFRSEGLRCTPTGRDGSRSIKKLAQDFGIPPWMRDRLPLLFIDGELAAVADYCHCAPFFSEDFQLRWHRPEWLT